MLAHNDKDLLRIFLKMCSLAYELSEHNSIEKEDKVLLETKHLERDVFLQLLEDFKEPIWNTTSRVSK